MQKANYIELSFCIWDFEDISHEELSKLIDLQPDEIFIKNEFTNAKSKRKSKENAWFLTNDKHRHLEFHDQMERLLNLLEPKMHILSVLSKKYYFEFSCAVFVQNKKESTPWIHLGKRYNDFVRNVNIEIDFDIYN